MGYTMEGPLGRFTECAASRRDGETTPSPLLDLLMAGVSALGRRGTAPHREDLHRHHD
ncbi:hypothetical protein [Phycicoccus sp.]|uniref:hypothetical protein n=1 Tax=Phycicoccus sp. TaxID=1902410 RepID=UPI002B52B2D7|nr:hypothetical protein [Phycicoccus sp.]HMM97235.1 hypothetical protein [Phycicoccus sp.]